MTARRHVDAPAALVARVSVVTIGPRPVAPRPHAEAPLARRTAIVALAFLAASALHVAWRGVDLAQLHRAFPLYALGGFGILIFGTTRLLIAGMAGRDVAGGAATSLVTTTLAALGALLAYVVPPGRLAALAVLPWSLAALAHVATIMATVRRAPSRPAILDPRADPRIHPALRALEAASLGYAALSAVLLPLAAMGRVAPSTAIHVTLVGFVIVTIMGTAAHVLPRFTQGRIPPVLLFALTPFAIAGPLLTALGAGEARGLLRAGAVVEGVAFVLFGVIVARLLFALRTRRPHHFAYLAAPLAIGVGGVLALAYAWSPPLARLLATHGLLNVYGFAGLVVIGASTDLYGPAMRPGAAPAKAHSALAAALTLFGLVVAGTSAALSAPDAARAGMALYAGGVAWQLAGLIATHRRAQRVVSRLRAG